MKYRYIIYIIYLILLYNIILYIPFASPLGEFYVIEGCEL